MFLLKFQFEIIDIEFLSLIKLNLVIAMNAHSHVVIVEREILDIMMTKHINVNAAGLLQNRLKRFGFEDYKQGLLL